MSKEEKIINTDNKDGQVKCPKCGASDVTLDEKRQLIVCNYCSHEFEKPKVKGKKDSKELKEDIRGEATKDINKDASNLVTIKCGGCGAEIVLNTEEGLNAKCHWCRSDLSINHQVDNGVVPDEILPFSISHEDAYQRILNYCQKKLTFATSEFRNGLTLENVQGLFFPYIIFDGKAHGHFKGFGEENTRIIHDDDDTYYDVDVYQVEREFDITVDDLTVESNSLRLDKFSTTQKNNVINAVMPFDTENCIQFQAMYMKGFTSEKRDIDIHELDDKIKSQMKDIARVKVNKTLSKYGRGVRWEYEGMEYSGKQWLSAYLPVWLYSCRDKKGVLHYVAVNGRTGETVGSIPCDRSKLYLTIFGAFLGFVALGILSFALLVSFASLLAVFAMLLCFACSFLVPLILFIVEDYRYSNLVWKRHSYEAETNCDIQFTNNVDVKTDHLKRVPYSQTKDANNNLINGDFVSVKKNTK